MSLTGFKFIHASYGGPLLRMRMPWGQHPRGRYLTFEDTRMFGPEWCRPNGEPLNRSIPAKSPFWPLYEAWCAAGKPVQGNRCIVPASPPTSGSSTTPADAGRGSDNG